MSNTNPPVFNPPEYQCRKCHTIIKSTYSGEYVSCKCGAIAVDSTEYYTRQIGNREDFLKYNENELK